MLTKTTQMGQGAFAGFCFQHQRGLMRFHSRAGHYVRQRIFSILRRPSPLILPFPCPLCVCLHIVPRCVLARLRAPPTLVRFRARAWWLMGAWRTSSTLFAKPLGCSCLLMIGLVGPSACFGTRDWQFGVLGASRRPPQGGLASAPAIVPRGTRLAVVSVSFRGPWGQLGHWSSSSVVLVDLAPESPFELHVGCRN